MNKKRDALLAAFDVKAAQASEFEALQGASWGRRLRRLLKLNVRYLRYLLSRFLPAGSTKARLFWGKKYLWGPPEHSTSLYLYGVLEHPSEVRLTRFLIRTLKDDDVFFDVGANFGFYSLLASELVGHGRICAFEPVPYVFAGLAANARLARGIEAFDKAVCDRSGPLEFNQAPACRHTGSSLSDGGTEFAFTKIKVDATTVDEFSARSGLVPTLMKIDVEGAEKLVIAGARKTLSSAAPTVVLEACKPPTPNQSHRDAARMLMDLGYRPHSLSEEGGLIALDLPALDAEFSGGETANLVFRK